MIMKLCLSAHGRLGSVVLSKGTCLFYKESLDALD